MDFLTRSKMGGVEAEEVYEDKQVTVETHTKRQYEMLKTFCKKQDIEMME